MARWPSQPRSHLNRRWLAAVKEVTHLGAQKREGSELIGPMYCSKSAGHARISPASEKKKRRSLFGLVVSRCRLFPPAPVSRIRVCHAAARNGGEKQSDFLRGNVAIISRLLIRFGLLPVAMHHVYCTRTLLNSQLLSGAPHSPKWQIGILLLATTTCTEELIILFLLTNI